MTDKQILDLIHQLDQHDRQTIETVLMSMAGTNVSQTPSQDTTEKKSPRGNMVFNVEPKQNDAMIQTHCVIREDPEAKPRTIRIKTWKEEDDQE